jgi:uncharacterized membrane protein
MRTSARILGHPIHPILIVFPLGLFSTAVVFDIVFFATNNPRWADVSFWMIVSGLIGGAAAAVFGLIDWLSIPSDTRANRVGLWHGLGNVVVMTLFGLSWLARYDQIGVTTAAFLLALSGLAISAVTGWLGGELVMRYGVGVDDAHDLNAPSSLSGGSEAHPSSPRRQMAQDLR